MSTLTDLVQQHCDLSQEDRDRLHLLVGDWQLLSDLSFADLVLWAPVRDGQGFVAVAMCRPSTGPTVHHHDIVGTLAPRGQRPTVDAAFDDVRVHRQRAPQWQEDVPVREEAVPVVQGGRPVAVLTRHTDLASGRTPSRLELTYQQLADTLLRMLSAGGYPVLGSPTGLRRGAPRVGDGLIRLDVDGTVLYASPNAVSVLHRLGFVGDLTRRSLVDVLFELAGGPELADEALPLVASGRAPWHSEVEREGVSLSIRALPLTDGPPVDDGGRRTGAIVLCRDVSELRRRERELLTKDATIREIHHRVKNNLQTVAALLRLQARRMSGVEARDALEEAMRRVSTIALVHETLSQGYGEWVDLDEVIDRGLALALDVTGAQGRAVMRRSGRFGTVRAEDATPLALALTELVTNAVEHGLGNGPGVVELHAEREDSRLTVTVSDAGAGLPADFSPGTSGLGTQIVQALVQGELRGRIDWEGRPQGGTRVTVEVRLHDDRSGDGVGVGA